MDAGHKYADQVLAQLAKQIAEDLNKTGKSVQEKIRKYLLKHKDLIDDLYEQLENGEITELEYSQQMSKALTVGKEWISLRNSVSNDMCNGMETALKATGSALAAIYLYNRTFTNQRIKQALKRKRRVVFSKVKGKQIVPKIPNRKKNWRWHNKKIESVVRQGMRKGQSIDKIAGSIKRVTGMDRGSAIRTARTAVTGAENSARIDSFEEASNMGIDMIKEWYATKDSRTRTSHRLIDGEKVPWNEYFSNNLYYPGDPDGDPAEVYNCRCTLKGSADGISLEDVPNAPEGKTREEWIAEKPIPKHYGESKSHYNKRESG